MVTKCGNEKLVNFISQVREVVFTSCN